MRAHAGTERQGTVFSCDSAKVLSRGRDVFFAALESRDQRTGLGGETADIEINIPQPVRDCPWFSEPAIGAIEIRFVGIRQTQHRRRHVFLHRCAYRRRSGFEIREQIGAIFADSGKRADAYCCFRDDAEYSLRPKHDVFHSWPGCRGRVIACGQQPARRRQFCSDEPIFRAAIAIRSLTCPAMADPSAQRGEFEGLRMVAERESFCLKRLFQRRAVYARFGRCRT